MAKPKGRPKSSDRDDVTVKLDRGIASKAKMVAAARSLTLTKYLSDITRAIVDKDFAKEMRQVEKGEGKP